MKLATGQTIIPTAVDERFRIRGPYWTPGMSILSEPWVALGESGAGHVVVPCGRNVEHARSTVARWRALHDRGLLVDVSRSVVGAAVVNPRGEVVVSWGAVPVPGGTPRWTPLHRVIVESVCRTCESVRWPGCWMTAELDGCAQCLPEREVADPRPWPREVSAPSGLVVVAREKTPKARRRAVKVTTVVSPEQGRLV